MFGCQESISWKRGTLANVLNSLVCVQTIYTKYVGGCSPSFLLIPLKTCTFLLSSSPTSSFPTLELKKTIEYWKRPSQPRRLLTPFDRIKSKRFIG